MIFLINVLFASAEADPFYKTGGLGEVTYSLVKNLNSLNKVNERIVIPYYEKLFPNEYKNKLKCLTSFYISLGKKKVYCGIKSVKVNGIIYYLIDNLYYFGRTSMYGYWDDGERFSFFQIAICEMMERIKYIPDILHLNDWQTSIIPLLLKERYAWIKNYKNIKTLLTIHNLKFQGIYNFSIMNDVLNIGSRTFNINGIEFYGKVNFLKAGINFSDAVNTVSEHYASEIQTFNFGEGLEGVLSQNKFKLSGIINGIDNTIYNPSMDSRLKYNYNIKTLDLKSKNKWELKKELELDQLDVPLVAVISRLTDQKGMQLILDSINELLKNKKIQLIVLGTGDIKIENAFNVYGMQYPKLVSVNIGFDNELAKEIYACCDIFLMPSKFEPSGLSQMIAMRYGTIPLVHETGGLIDTVNPYNKFTSEGDGFSFKIFDNNTFYNVLKMTLDLYKKYPKEWRKLQVNAMKRDFSWKKSVSKYYKLYKKILS